MSETLIILLILGGLLFVLLEILVIPGVGVVGIFGGAMIIVAIVGAYGISATHGHVALGGSLLLSVGLIFLSIKANTWKRISLNKEIEGRVNTRDENIVKEGDTGFAVSRLNPMGKAIINEELFEVESAEGYIQEGMEIKVIKVSSHKIRVKSNTESIIKAE
jgi:membrane-bound ClpP family serine protease